MAMSIWRFNEGDGFSMTSVAVVDYGMGNIGSICKMLRFIGAEPIVTSDKDVIAACDRILLPGVGHFDRAISNLMSLGLVDHLRVLANEGSKPMLGICLGMQLLCQAWGFLMLVSVDLSFPAVHV
jgi:glutamine amidotransferase